MFVIFLVEFSIFFCSSRCAKFSSLSFFSRITWRLRVYCVIDREKRKNANWIIAIKFNWFLIYRSSRSDFPRRQFQVRKISLEGLSTQIAITVQLNFRPTRKRIFFCEARKKPFNDGLSREPVDAIVSLRSCKKHWFPFRHELWHWKPISSSTSHPWKVLRQTTINESMNLLIDSDVFALRRLATINFLKNLWLNNQEGLNSIPDTFRSAEGSTWRFCPTFHLTEKRIKFSL